MCVRGNSTAICMYMFQEARNNIMIENLASLDVHVLNNNNNLLLRVALLVHVIYGAQIIHVQN